MNIGICLGDVAGIGPEVVVKALASRKLARGADCHIIGDERMVAATCRRLGVKLNARVIECDQDDNLRSIPFGSVNVRSARAAAAWIRYGVELCLTGRLDALVT